MTRDRNNIKKNITPTSLRLPRTSVRWCIKEEKRRGEHLRQTLFLAGKEAAKQREWHKGDIEIVAISENYYCITTKEGEDLTRTLFIAKNMTIHIVDTYQAHQFLKLLLLTELIWRERTLLANHSPYTSRCDPSGTINCISTLWGSNFYWPLRDIQIKQRDQLKLKWAHLFQADADGVDLGKLRFRQHKWASTKNLHISTNKNLRISTNNFLGPGRRPRFPPRTSSPGSRERRKTKR